MSTEQIRGQFERARQTSDPVKQSRLVETALTNRATGRIVAKTYHYDSSLGHDCDGQNIATPESSGQLTSDSRMVTTHHGMGALDSSKDKPLTVTFETDFHGLGDQNNDGNFVDYTRSTPNYTFDRTDTKKAAEHENPLLANRLFALGLEKWAEDSHWTVPSPQHSESFGRDQRKALREEWPFAVDGTREQQREAFQILGPEPNPAPCESRLDIFVIKAEVRENIDFAESEESEDYLASGAFQIGKPGVFFNAKPYDKPQEGDDESCRISGDTELYGLQYTSWPWEAQSTPADGAVPLVANPGYLDPATEESNDYEICLGPNEPNECTAVNLVETTLDVRTGSSGGQVQTLDIENEDSGCRRVGENTQGAGVVHGAAYSDEDLIDGNPAWWGHYCQQEDCEPPDPHETPDDEVRTYVTRVNEAVAKWSRRDIDFSSSAPDPFDPEPDQPAPDSNLNCQEYLGEEETCIRYETYEPPPPRDGQDDPIDVSIPGHRTPTPNDDEPDPEEGFDTRECGYYGTEDHPLNWSPRVGLATGFMGAATSVENAPTTGIGHLQLICAPWSDAAHTDNWGFTELIGREVEPDEDVLRGGDLGYRQELPVALRRYYELRDTDPADEDPNDIVPRPVSFKTCPPNYYMRGFTFTVDSDDETVGGIQQLECVRANPNGHVESLTVSMTPSPSQKYDNFEMFYEPFSLTQRIGNPKANGYDVASYSCNADGNHQNWAISKWTFDASQTGKMKLFNIACQQLPTTSPSP